MKSVVDNVLDPKQQVYVVQSSSRTLFATRPLPSHDKQAHHCAICVISHILFQLTFLSLPDTDKNLPHQALLCLRFSDVGSTHDLQAAAIAPTPPYVPDEDNAKLQERLRGHTLSNILTTSTITIPGVFERTATLRRR